MGKQRADGMQHQGLDGLQSLKLAHKKLQAVEVSDHMLLVPGVLTVAEAQQFIDAAESAGFEHQSSRGSAYGEAFRDNHRISVQDEALAGQLWHRTGLKNTLTGVTVDGMVAVGLNPNIRFYKYTAGQKFGKHIDDSVEVAPGHVTAYTLLVYLSGQADGGGLVNKRSINKSSNSSSSSRSNGSRARQRAAGTAIAASVASNFTALQQLVGGETIFYSARNRVVACVAPAPGLALLHLHGEDRCLEHEAAEVQQGVKYVLRSDVVFAVPN